MTFRDLFARTVHTLLGAGSLAAGTWLLVEPAGAGALLQLHATESAATQEPLLRRLGAGYIAAGLALVWGMTLAASEQTRVRLGLLLFFAVLAAVQAGEWQAGIPAGAELAAALVLLPPLLLALLFVPTFDSSGGRSRGGASEHAPAGTETGTIKWFDGRKGFGFINRANGEELFVHYRSISEAHGGSKALRDGQPVRFRVGQGKKGPQAEDVIPLGKNR